MSLLLAVSMGSQLAAIRQLEAPDMLTVVLTLTITGALTERGAGLPDPKVMRRGLTVVAFVAGALSGALLIRCVAVAAAVGLGLFIVVAVGVVTHILSRGEPARSTPS